MKSEFVVQDKNRVEIKVEFEPSEFNAELNKVFENISKRASIPGFRKGHVPRKTIEMRFGKASIYDETVENLLNENIQSIIEDYELEPLMAPQIKSKDPVVEGQPVTANLIFENRPEIILPELQEIEVEKLIAVVDDEAVEEMVNNLRKSQASHEKTESPVADDSIVTVNFTVSIAPGRASENATISMEEAPSPEFREALLGKNAGDEVSVEINNPNPEAKEEDKKVRYEMKILEVGKKVLPEMTPEFFKKAIGKDCKNEDEFRNEIANRMLTGIQKQSERDTEGRLMSILSEKAQFDVPGILVHRELQAIKANDEKDAKERYQTDLAGLIKLRGIEPEEYEKQVMMRAFGTVRASLILDELGRKFELKIEPSELDEWLKQRSESDGIDYDILRKAYYRDRDTLNMLADRVFTDKVMKLVMSKIKVKEVSELTPPKSAEEKTEE